MSLKGISFINLLSSSTFQSGITPSNTFLMGCGNKKIYIYILFLDYRQLSGGESYQLSHIYIIQYEQLHVTNKKATTKQTLKKVTNNTNTNTNNEGIKEKNNRIKSLFYVWLFLGSNTSFWIPNTRQTNLWNFTNSGLSTVENKYSKIFSKQELGKTIPEYFEHRHLGKYAPKVEIFRYVKTF